jgi:hypothetical protein
MAGINFHQGYKRVTRILKTGSKINFFLHVYACNKKLSPFSYGRECLADVYIFQVHHVEDGSAEFTIKLLKECD